MSAPLTEEREDTRSEAKALQSKNEELNHTMKLTAREREQAENDLKQQLQKLRKNLRQVSVKMCFLLWFFFVL